MAPERFAGRTVDHRVDIYALDCILYEMLTGNPPYAGADYPALLFQHLNAQPCAPARCGPISPVPWTWSSRRAWPRTPRRATRARVSWRLTPRPRSPRWKPGADRTVVPGRRAPDRPPHDGRDRPSRRAGPTVDGTAFPAPIDAPSSAGTVPAAAVALVRGRGRGGRRGDGRRGLPRRAARAVGAGRPHVGGRERNQCRSVRPGLPGGPDSSLPVGIIDTGAVSGATEGIYRAVKGGSPCDRDGLSVFFKENPSIADLWVRAVAGDPVLATAEASSR
jgi:hypothetical protein